MKQSVYCKKFKFDADIDDTCKYCTHLIKMVKKDSIQKKDIFECPYAKGD